MLCVLVNTRFQVLFHSPPGVLFTFPSQYCSTIGHQVVFRLGGWSPRIPIGFHVSDGTLDTASQLNVSPTGLSPSTVSFPTLFEYVLLIDCAVRTPTVLLLSVWPFPLSLATTRGISVDFFSSPYLDVSVREVPHVKLCIHLTLHLRVGFPIRKSADIMLICSSPRLIAACHVLLRLLMPRHSPCALFRLHFHK